MKKMLKLFEGILAGLAVFAPMQVLAQVVTETVAPHALPGPDLAYVIQVGGGSAVLAFVLTQFAKAAIKRWRPGTDTFVWQWGLRALATLAGTGAGWIYAATTDGPAWSWGVTIGAGGGFFCWAIVKVGKPRLLALFGGTAPATPAPQAGGPDDGGGEP